MVEEDLVERFKKGQIALHKQIDVIRSKPKRLQDAYWQGFDKGIERLRLIASQMENKCPYENDELPSFGWCLACPVEGWSKEKCKAWNKF